MLLYLLPQHCRDKEWRKPLCLCSPLPLIPASLFSNAMFKLINFDYGWGSLRVKNTTSCLDLVCIWQNTGKPTALTHLHRKVKMAKSSTEQHNSLVSLCSLAAALMVTSPAPRAGRLTYFFVLELAQGPDSSKMPTGTSPVWQTLHYLLDGDCPLFCRRRAAHCWWGVGNPGTPVILHNRARDHSENLQWLVFSNTPKRIKSLPTGSLLL